MKLLLACVVLLVFVILFRVREGYYSDSNTASAISSLQNVSPTLSDLTNTLQRLEAIKLDVADTLRNLNSVLGSSDSELDTNGVISNVRRIKAGVNIFQDNLMAMTTALKEIKNIKVNISDGRGVGSIPLGDAIPLLQTQIDVLSDKLRRIPDT